MSNYIVPFSEAKNLPTNFTALGADDDWESGVSGGFPVISIDGKVFHINRGGESTLITRPDDPDEAATSIEVVILRANKGVGRVYYVKKYEQGDAEAPDCTSSDGVAPDPDAKDPQSKTCATCPHSQWGSRITENGKKGKACSEVKRLAVAAPNALDDPMLLRVPPTSLKNWDALVSKLRKRGLAPVQIVTKVGFDPSVSHQLLTFKPMGFVHPDQVNEIVEARDSKVVQDICSVATTAPAPAQEPAAEEQADDDGFGNLDEPAPAQTKEADPEPAPAPEEKPAPVRRMKPAQAAQEAQPEKKAEPKKSAPVKEVDDLESDLDDMLSDMDFDD